MIKPKGQLESEGISLYRYEPDCCKRLYALQEGGLYISDPRKFNDPLDLHLSIADRTHRLMDENKFREVIKLIYEQKLLDRFYIFNDDIIKNIKDWSQNTLGVNTVDLINVLKERILSFGVQCFSLGYDIPLQWSHYGKSHKGFCVEYDFRPMDLVYKDSKLAYYHVSYTNKLPEVCVSEILLTPHQVVEKLLATKTLEWAYEQEIRIINFEKQGQAIDMPEGLSIKSLIAGINMSDMHLHLLKQAGRKLGVPVYQMQKNQCEFGPLWNRIELL